MRELCGRRVKAAGKAFGQGVTDVFSAREDFFHGAHNLVGRRVFGDVTGGAGFQNAHGKLVLGMHAEDEDSHARAGFHELLKDIEAAAAGHGDVQKHDVPGLIMDLFDCFRAAAGFAKDRLGEGIGQDSFEALADDGVVIHDKKMDDTFGGFGAGFGAGGRGLSGVIIWLQWFWHYCGVWISRRSVPGPAAEAC